MSNEGMQTLPGFPMADHCQAYTAHYPEPLRYVWHHVLPQGAGGKTVPANLITVCDNCHYAIHALLHYMAKNNGALPPHAGEVGQIQFATAGYQRAFALGTVGKIPNEGSLE